MTIKKTSREQVVSAIAKELGVAVKRITELECWGSFFSFRLGGQRYTNRLTRTGRHQKNSIRVEG